MHIRKSPFIKVVSVLLLITFISFDITWAQPQLTLDKAQKLSADIPFQQGNIDPDGADFNASLFDDIKLQVFLRSVAKFLLEDRIPLKYLDTTLSSELVELPEGVDLSRIELEDGIVTVHLERSNVKGKIKIVRKDNEIRSQLTGKELPSVSDGLIIKAVLVDHQDVNGHIKENIPADVKAETPEERLAKLKTAYPDNYFESANYNLNGDKVGAWFIPIDGLKKETGIKAHIGLGQAYGVPVVYVDSAYIGDTEVREHEFYEIAKWEEKRLELGLSPKEMRAWILSNMEEARELAKKFHKENPHNVAENKPAIVKFIYSDSTDVILAATDEETRKALRRAHKEEFMRQHKELIDAGKGVNGGIISDRAWHVIARRVARQMLDKYTTRKDKSWAKEILDPVVYEALIAEAGNILYEKLKLRTEVDTEAVRAFFKKVLTVEEFAGEVEVTCDVSIIWKTTENEDLKKELSDKLGEYAMYKEVNRYTGERAKKDLGTEAYEALVRALWDILWKTGSLKIVYAVMGKTLYLQEHRTSDRPIVRCDFPKLGKIIERRGVNMPGIYIPKFVDENEMREEVLRIIKSKTSLKGLHIDWKKDLPLEAREVVIAGSMDIARETYFNGLLNALGDAVELYRYFERGEAAAHVIFHFDKFAAEIRRICGETQSAQMADKYAGINWGDLKQQAEKEMERLKAGENLKEVAEAAEPDDDKQAKLAELEESVNSSKERVLKTLFWLEKTFGAEFKKYSGYSMLAKHYPSSFGLDAIDSAIGLIEEMEKTQGLTEEQAAIFKQLKEEAEQFRADSMVGAVLLLARKAERMGQKLIIGVETEWIPGMMPGGLQQGTLTPTIKEIKRLKDKLRDMGLNNVIFVEERGDDLAGVVKKTADDNATDLTNVVVLASQVAVDSPTSGLREIMTTRDEEKAFVAVVDASELHKHYAEHGEALDQQLRIRFGEMLCLALELATGAHSKVKDLSWLGIQYNPDLRTVTFLPKAEPMNYELLRNLNAAEAIALQSA